MNFDCIFLFRAVAMDVRSALSTVVFVFIGLSSLSSRAQVEGKQLGPFMLNFSLSSSGVGQER